MIFYVNYSLLLLHFNMERFGNSFEFYVLFTLWSSWIIKLLKLNFTRWSSSSSFISIKFIDYISILPESTFSLSELSFVPYKNGISMTLSFLKFAGVANCQLCSGLQQRSWCRSAGSMTFSSGRQKWRKLGWRKFEGESMQKPKHRYVPSGGQRRELVTPWRF